MAQAIAGYAPGVVIVDRASSSMPHSCGKCSHHNFREQALACLIAVGMLSPQVSEQAAAYRILEVLCTMPLTTYWGKQDQAKII